MNHSRPMGALGGGGWEAGSLSAASVSQQSLNHKKKDKVLADMYEMFLDTLDTGVIECVVESCEYNHKKSMDALMEMAGTSCGTTQSSHTLPKRFTSTPSTPEIRNASGHLINLSMASTQSSRNSIQLDERVATKNSSHQEKKPMSSPKNPIPKENKLLPLSVNGYGRQRNSSGTPNLYFPARKKKNSGNEIGQVKWYIENNCRVMILLRGCPGSGKSYFARRLVLSYGGDPKDFIFSTDDYFIKNNVYRFDPMSLSDAHGWNQRRCLSNAREGRSPIIIDNTNTQLWEMTVYATIAVNHGYAIVILEPDTPWFENLNELTKRNQHGVPKDRIRAMLERYEQGITVEALLLSTGSKYAKPPPQPAEKSITKLVSAKIQNHHGSISENQDNIYVSNPKSSKKKNENVEQESAASSNLPGVFYFGSNDYKRVDMCPDSATQVAESHTYSTKEEYQKVIADGKTNSIPPKVEEQPFKLLGSSKEADVTKTNSTSRKFDIVDSLENMAVSSPSNEFKFSHPDILDFKSEPAVNSSKAVNSLEQKNAMEDKNILENDGESSKLVSAVSFGDSSNTEIIASKFLCDSDIGSGDSSHSKCNDSFELLSFSNLQIANAKEESVTKNPNSLISLSSFGDLLADRASRWNESPERDGRENIAQNESVYQNSVPKPPRSFSMKNIQDYCDSVKDMNAVSDTETSSYSFCENSAISWLPIEAEVFQPEKSLCTSPVALNTQRSKFKKFDVADKGCNTNHTDFCLLNNYSSGTLEDGVRILNTYDRDINEGRIVSSSKVFLKLMLDKSTFTENDFEGEPKSKSKQEKIKELVRLFPTRSSASIKELLKQCNWDVNYVSNILLDDTDNPSSSFASDENNDADSEVESSSEEQPEDSDADRVESAVSSDIHTCEDILTSKTAQEEAEKVKRHIELSFDFNEGYYSPHTLAIKNLRRGKREGAIPKTQAVSLGEADIPTVESPQEASDSSDDGNETLEFIVGKDFIQQLVDKFGNPYLKAKDLSPVVKFPVNLARQIYDVIFSAFNSEDEEGDGDIAVKLQCEEDERMARQLYEEMRRNTGHSVDSTPPQLREIMDMELAQAIYKADVDSLTDNSPDTIANILAKRLLEDNYSHIDKKTLHDIFVSCKCSFEDTVKTLQEALSPDGAEQNRKVVPQQACMDNAQSEFSERHESIENAIGIENPWELSDPKEAYNKYREKADEYLKQRDEMYRKANEAFTRKERSVAAYYSKLGEVHGNKFHHASAMAAAALAAAHKDLHSSDTLDLHHFKVVEAVTVFDLFMDYHIRTVPESGLQQRSLDIITGRGTHSVNGKPRIKPAIMNRAKKRNLRCQQVAGNPGVLKIWVSSNSFLSHEVPE